MRTQLFIPKNSGLSQTPTVSDQADVMAEMMAGCIQNENEAGLKALFLSDAQTKYQQGESPIALLMRNEKISFVAICFLVQVLTSFKTESEKEIAYKVLSEALCSLASIGKQEWVNYLLMQAEVMFSDNDFLKIKIKINVMLVYSAADQSKFNAGSLAQLPSDSLLEILTGLSPAERHMLKQGSKYWCAFVNKANNNLFFKAMANASPAQHHSRMLGWEDNNKNKDVPIDTLKLYFSKQSESVNFATEFLKSLQLQNEKSFFDRIFSSEDKKECLIVKSVQGLSGPEYCFEIKLPEIADNITLKSIHDLLMLFGDKRLPLGANFFQVTNGHASFIDNKSQIPATMMDDHYFNIYYESYAVAVLTKILISNITKTKARNIVSVYPQKGYSNREREFVLSIHLNKIELTDADLQHVLSEAMKILFTNEMFNKTNEILMTLLMMNQRKEADRHAGCRLF